MGMGTCVPAVRVLWGGHANHRAFPCSGLEPNVEPSPTASAALWRSARARPRRRRVDTAPPPGGGGRN